MADIHESIGRLIGASAKRQAMIPQALQHIPKDSGANGAALYFSTGTHPGAHSFEAWRKVGRFEVTAQDPARFHADIRVRPFPSGMVLSHHQLGACSVMRPAAMRSNDDAVMLKCCLGGTFDARLGDDHVRLLPGQAALLPYARLNDTRVGEDSKSYTLRLERDTARALIPRFEPAALRVLQTDGPELMLLRRYCDLVMSQDLPGPLARTACDHLGELVAHGFGGTAEIASGQGVRAARLYAIKQDIIEGIGRRDLSVDAITSRHRISSSYIRKLFEAEGATFTDFVLGERLTRAHRMLLDRRFTDRPISTIAFAVGFNDLSYFNRAFRRRFGMTPSDVRAAARIL